MFYRDERIALFIDGSTFSIRSEDETVLAPGMTIHFMPALWMEDWGLEITEPLLIREQGPAECLADYPRKLFVKP